MTIKQQEKRMRINPERLAQIEAVSPASFEVAEPEVLTEAGFIEFDLKRARDRRDPAHERREQDRRERVAMSEIPNWFRHNQGA